MPADVQAQIGVGKAGLVEDVDLFPDHLHAMADLLSKPKQAPGGDDEAQAAVAQWLYSTAHCLEAQVLSSQEYTATQMINTIRSGPVNARFRVSSRDHLSRNSNGFPITRRIVQDSFELPENSNLPI